MFRSLAFIAVFIALTNSAPTGHNVNVTAVSFLNNYVGAKFFDVLGSEEGNLFFSPLSLSTLISTLYVGARGLSQQELGGLGYGMLDYGNISVPASYQKLLKYLQSSSDEYKLEIANALLSQADYPLLEEYKAILTKYYDALQKEVDFAQKKKEAIQEINGWVDQKTHGKISKLVDDIDDSTFLVLLNAVYFKGTWKTEFDPDMTKQLPFYNNGGSNSKSVPIMKLKNRFPYAYYDDKRLQALELPYKGEDISMLILLPFERDGIQRLQEEINCRTINDIMNRLDDTKVTVSLPKFKLEYSRNLKEDFKSIGIKTIFGPGADFSGMSGNKDLYVSEIVHKALIEVNEEGSEASAVSGGFISNRMRPLPEIIEEFNADHPFLFYIIDNLTKTTLFVGRVNEL